MKKYSIFILLSIITSNLYASDFDVAMGNVRLNCSGISQKLSDLKKLAGINTVVTGVGTAAATGATVAGISKASVDKRIEEILEPLARISSDTKNPSEIALLAVYNKYYGETTANIQNVKKSEEEKSKTLGHWRTGLLGGSAVTNIAGAVIASNNTMDDDLQRKIESCIISVDNLKSTLGQARTDGIDITKASNIVMECGDWKNVDLSVIDNRAKGAMVSSLVGAATGAAGTVTSAIANSDDVRSGDEAREKHLNTASNVLAGGTVVASGVATVFNATQINAIKKIINVAEGCENAL